MTGASSRIGARSRITDMLRLVAPPAVAGLVVFALVRFPPDRYNFYPQCPIHELLGLQCPGCGATRAIAELLRGHFAHAMHLNALITVLFPIVAGYGILWHSRLARRKPLRWQRPPSVAIYAALALAVVFTTIRNLPIRFF